MMRGLLDIIIWEEMTHAKKREQFESGSGLTRHLFFHILLRVSWIHSTGPTRWATCCKGVVKKEGFTDILLLFDDAQLVTRHLMGRPLVRFGFWPSVIDGSLSNCACYDQ